jgi:hypothetical protein
LPKGGGKWAVGKLNKEVAAALTTDEIRKEVRDALRVRALDKGGFAHGG